MKADGKIVAVIPSRMGSNRIPMKGMRLLGDKTLIEYTVSSIKKSRFFSERVFINSDAVEWSRLAESLGVEFYHRKSELATSASMIDDYLYDFMCNIPMDYLAVITPTAPFVTEKDLDNAWEHYINSPANTLISAESILTHCFFNGKPLNFSTAGQLPRSQDLQPVKALNFSIAIYDCRFFRMNYEKHGYAVLAGEIETFSLDNFAAIDIDEEKDFIMAELALRFQQDHEKYTPRYSQHIQGIINSEKDTKN